MICWRRERPTSSERVGSSALDLMDCMACRFERVCPRRHLAYFGRGCGKQIRHREVGGAKLGDDSAAIEHERAVTYFGNFLEVGRDDDNGRACLQGHIEKPIDLRLGADIDAGSRILEDIN